MKEPAFSPGGKSCVHRAAHLQAFDLSSLSLKLLTSVRCWSSGPRMCLYMKQSATLTKSFFERFCEVWN